MPKDMDLLSQDELKTALGIASPWCLSIYIPTTKAGREVTQNPVRLKNALQRAGILLADRGCSAGERDEILEPGYALLDNDLFWRYQSRSLCVLLAPNYQLVKRIPEDVPELVVVNDHFHVKPLLSVIKSQESSYFVLALSAKEVKLYECSGGLHRVVQVPDMPTSLEEALPQIENEPQLQWHTRSQTVRGTSPGGFKDARFFGSGGGDIQSEKKLRIKEFFQVLCGALERFLAGRRTPLVVAAVEYFQPIFREVCGYWYLLPQSITGSPDEMAESEIVSRAAAIVAPELARRKQELYDRVKDLEPRKLASLDIETIVKAAHRGMIDTALVAADKQIWGRYEEEDEGVKVHPDRRPGDSDLLDLVARKTVEQGGSVHVVPSEGLPPLPLGVAAVFRGPLEPVTWR